MKAKHHIYSNLFLLFVISTYLIDQTLTFGLPGKFHTELNKDNYYFAVSNRGFYNKTKIQVKIECNEGTKRVKIGWLLRLSECMDEFYLNSEQLPKNIFSNIFDTPFIGYQGSKAPSKFQVIYLKQNLTEFKCDETLSIDLKSIPPPIRTSGYSRPIQNSGISENESIKRDVQAQASKHIRKKRQIKINDSIVLPATSQSPSKAPLNLPPASYDHSHSHFDDESVVDTWQDGPYSFIISTEAVNDENYVLDVVVSFKYMNGYLSANDWPFLPFYGVMCGIYSLYAIFWLVCSLCYWRDLLRIQIWIGGVILLGLMEKAAYLAEYDAINRNGYSGKVAMIVAEVISCFKRSLARMLVIIVSLGFGIVKPRLGPTMQKVVGVGGLYFVFALVDGIFRIIERREDTDSKGVLAGVPLVFIDVSICYWILSNLQQTMRTLRVRRNIPKLTLYRHFTNTLIFCVFASVVFMIWSLTRHRFVDCLKDWKELWLDEGFWHILFSFILLVIIILWRPSKNAQRFAFTPLIDNDDDLDEEEDIQESEIFDSIKMRTKQNNNQQDSTTVTNSALVANAVGQSNQKSSIEDDLKWVEENVPATIAEAALPALVDSEEEVVNTRFEISKMD